MVASCSAQRELGPPRVVYLTLLVHYDAEHDVPHEGHHLRQTPKVSQKPVKSQSKYSQKQSRTSPMRAWPAGERSPAHAADWLGLWPRLAGGWGNRGQPPALGRSARRLTRRRAGPAMAQAWPRLDPGLAQPASPGPALSLTGSTTFAKPRRRCAGTRAKLSNCGRTHTWPYVSTYVEETRHRVTTAEQVRK